MLAPSKILADKALTTLAGFKPKLAKVMAKKEKPFNIEYTKLIRDLFTDAAKKTGKLAGEIGSRIRFKYKQANWELIRLELNEDGTVAAKLTSQSKVPVTLFKSRGFAEHKHIFTDDIVLIIRDAFGIKRNGRGYVQLDLWLRLSAEQVKTLCGGAGKPEKFMIATALTTLADNKFQNMTLYTDPKTLKTRKKSQKTNIVVRLPTGRLLYLPAVDTRDKITKELRESFDEATLKFDTDRQTFKHDIIYWNLAVGELKYISSNGQQMSYAISGSSELSRSATLSILNAQWRDIVIELGRNPKESLMGALRLFLENNYPDRANFTFGVYDSAVTPSALIREAILYFEEAQAKEMLEGFAKWLRQKDATQSISHPLRRYSVLAIARVMADWCGKVDALEQEIKDKIAAMQNATIVDMPALPGNFREDLEFYPHQADTLAKTNLADESIGLDVSTGGGKTILLLAHILKEIQKGNINRPLIVMPVNLISQWFDEIHYFTNSSVNCVILSTETARKWGMDALTELVKSSPKNTIFLSTYSWVAYKPEVQIIGGRKTWFFPRVEYLRGLNFDAVFLDESHRAKNAKSNNHQAIIQLGQMARRKGIATGTITPNKQSDIVGQMTFIDPALFGTKDDFEEEFLTDKKTGTFAEGAEEVIQERLRSVGVISKTRKDWFYTLPKINDNYHIVKMSQLQADLYNSLVTDALQAFQTDPEFITAWTEFQMDPESENIPAQFLARLHLIESFSSDPAASPFGIEGLLKGDDLISPKVPKILEILEKHFTETPDEKVLIFTQYQAKVIDHVYNNLGSFQKMAKLYRGGMIKNLDAFKQDPKVKILVACDRSIKEGHNLQMASRMIRMDVHWSPGDLDQVIARIYRLQKGSEREFINIDWVLSDNTIDVLKFRRTIRKLVLNSTMMGIIPKDAIPQRPIITVNPDSLVYAVDWNAAWSDEVDDYRRYRQLEAEQWEEIRKTQPIEFVPVKTDDKISGEIINTPIPQGASIPGGDDKVTAEDALDEWGKGDPKNLIGHKCDTEFGPGVINSATRNSAGVLKLGIEFEDESIEPKSLPGTIVEVHEEKDPDFGQKKVNITNEGVDVEIGGILYWLTPDGFLHKTRKTKGVYVLGKIRFVFDGHQWITPTGRSTSKVTPKIDAGLRKALKAMGYKFPRGSGVVPKEEVEPEYKFKRTEDGVKKSFALKPNGDICVLNKQGKCLKPHINFEDGEWIYLKGIKKGKKAFTGKVEKRLLQELKKLGYKPKRKKVPPKTPKKAPTKTPKIQPEPTTKHEGYRFKTPRGFHRLMVRDGTIYILKPKTGELRVKYLFDEGAQTWVTEKGRAVRFTPQEHKKLMAELNKLKSGTAPKKGALKRIKKSPKKAPDAIQPLSVELKTINFGGVSAIAIFYDEEREKELQLAVKAKKFYPFTFKRLAPITVPKLTRLKQSFAQKKIKPKNLLALEPILENWRKAEMFMKDYDKATIKEFKGVMKLGWKSLVFYMQPTIIDGKLELWIPTMKERAYKKHLRELERLKFTDGKIFMRHFLLPSTLSQAGTFLLAALKTKKIQVSNLKAFKDSIKAIKKRVR